MSEHIMKAWLNGVQDEIMLPYLDDGNASEKQHLQVLPVSHRLPHFLHDGAHDVAQTRDALIATETSECIKDV